LGKEFESVHQALRALAEVIQNRTEKVQALVFSKPQPAELPRAQPLQYPLVAAVHMEDIVDDELDLPPKLPGNVRYQGLKRKPTLENENSNNGNGRRDAGTAGVPPAMSAQREQVGQTFQSVLVAMACLITAQAPLWEMGY
jgi:hypothetical protein